jgi:hypothetical protein
VYYSAGDRIVYYGTTPALRDNPIYAAYRASMATDTWVYDTWTCASPLKRWTLREITEDAIGEEEFAPSPELEEFISSLKKEATIIKPAKWRNGNEGERQKPLPFVATGRLY